MAPNHFTILNMIVATVLTVYGIETNVMAKKTKKKFSGKLQQYLPFTVLKLNRINE